MTYLDMRAGILCATLTVAFFPLTPSAAPLKAKRTIPDKTTAAAKPIAPHKDGRIESILVTADRKTQTAQTVPTSISVVSAKTLENRNITSVFDLQYVTPSLQIQPSYGSGQFTYTIRGVGFSGYSSNNSPTVGIYVDEVSNPVPLGTNGQMFDMARVEVLRGPQGTLYGRNTTGGAINYITNRPTDSFQAGIAAQDGRFNAATVDGYISGPINEKLSVRLAGQTQQGGAWQYNPEKREWLGDANRGAARLLMDFHPDESWQILFNLHGNRDRSDGTGVHPWSPITALSTTNPIPVSPDRYQTLWGTSQSFADQIGITPGATPYSHLDMGGLNFRVQKKLRRITLVNLTSFDNMKRNEYNNFDGSSKAIADVSFRTRANVVSEEFRVSSNSKSRLEWIGGVFYGYQWLNDRYQSGFVDLNKTNGDVRYSQVVNTISGFGQATYHVTHAFQIVGGVRIEHEKRGLNNLYAHYIVNNIVTNPNNIVDKRSLSYTLPSARFSLQYTPFSRDMLYFTFSKGIKSGGYTVYNTSNARDMSTPFKPENLYAFELGNKLVLPEYNLKINADFFYYDYFNRQVQSQTVSPISGAIGVYVNAPRSHEYGGEYEVEWSPIERLRIAQSGAYVTGAYDKFSTITKVVKVDGLWQGIMSDAAGQKISVPSFTANGSVDYTWRLGRYDLTGGLDYSLRTSLRFLTPINDLAGYTLWGGYIAFAPRKGHWKVEAIGRNITDKQYDVTRGRFISGDNIALAGMPATWLLRVRGDL